MHKLETHFIPENIAPKGAQKIIVKDSANNEVGTIPLGSLTPPSSAPDYRVIVVSDIHIGLANTSDEFAAVLVEADEDPLCTAVIVCGDLVNNGLTESQRTSYKALIDVAETPVYSIAGNHDAIWGYPTDEFVESYAGYPFYYAVANTADETNRIYANAAISETDLLIFLGYNGKDHSAGNGDWRGGEQFSTEELAWFESIMAANTDKRRLVFMHPYIPDGAGDPPLADDSPKSEPPDIWTKKSTVTTDAGVDFLAILATYPGAIVFNGHSHYRFRTQEEQSIAIIYEPADSSYTSVHVPSLTKLRDVQDGWRIDLDTSSEDYGGEGFIIDAYSDCLHLRGRDFINGAWVGIGTYKITTT